MKSTGMTRSTTDSLPRVTIYTDGGCKPNPGPGGWGAVILPAGEDRIELHGSVDETTNNRMEILAAREALRSLGEPSRVDLYTDSAYLKHGITRWIDGWRSRGWVTTAKTPVQNRDLWQTLDKEARRHEIDWHWVESHSGDRWNERAHELASQGLEAATPTEIRESMGPGPDVEAFLGVAWSAKRSIGAWGVLLRHGDHEKTLSGAARLSSPNAAHIRSALEALRALRRPVPIRLHSLSDYLCNGASRWVHGWKRRNWKTRAGEPVKNAELWRSLDARAKQMKTLWVTIDGEIPEEIVTAKEAAREALEEGIADDE